MKSAYDRLSERSEEIKKSVVNLCKDESAGLIEVGSGAYGRFDQGVVTSESDLDLAAVFNFSAVNLKEWCRALHIPFDEVAESCIKDNEANIVVTNFGKNPGVCLQMFDVSAFKRTTELYRGVEKILRDSDFNGSSALETLTCLRSKDITVNPTHREEYQGRVVQKVNLLYEEKNQDIYLGSILWAFLLGPRVLYEHSNKMHNMLDALRQNFVNHVKRIYGNKRLSLSVNAVLPERLKSKIPSVVISELDDLIRNQ